MSHYPVPLQTAYVQGTGYLHQTTYDNGRTAWLLKSARGERLCIATVNLPAYEHAGLDAGTHVLIKDWGENQGLLQSLQACGLLTPLDYISTGYVQAVLCLVTPFLLHVAI